MSYNPEIHHRRSIRLKGYDYTQSGAYFITICTHNRDFIFGDITDGTMRLNEFGMLVESEWRKTAKIRGNLSLDEYVVMPNHIHGIIIINRRGTGPRAPTGESFGKPISGSLPTIIRSFKSTTTRQINRDRRTPGLPVWQRSYYEHIIRGETELDTIRKYINENPMKWDLDSENPFNELKRNDGADLGKESPSWELITHSPEQTRQIGADLGELAQNGDLILLVGNLGAGKTCFTQGVARGVGFNGYASSPSFVLVREYQGRVKIYHIDLYRIEDDEEIADLGIDDYLSGNAICVVEWADKALNWFPEKHLLIEFEHQPAEDERLLRFKPDGERYIDLLKELKEKWNSL